MRKPLSAATLRAGNHVTFLWKNKTALHSLHFLGDPAAALPPSDSTAIYDRKFTTTGVYYYYCDVHGAPSGLGVTGMSGKITVNQ